MSLLSQGLERTKGISSAVMLEHTLFSLPLAVAAFLLETQGHPEGMTVLWIILAIFGARNGANALNRLIDHEIDAANPRTADRDLPSGRVKRVELWAFTAFCAALFLLSAWMLNPLCLILVPLGAVMIGGYSFSKRFTWLCHYWLGITCSAATMGSFLAISGRFELRYFPLTMGAALWVAGFDILYALQDIEHDRKEGLNSVPARFGRNGALIIAGLSHSAVVLCWIVNGLFFEMGPIYYFGLFLAALMLLAENLIAMKGSIKWIPFASYKINQVLAPLFMIFTIVDIYL